VACHDCPTAVPAAQRASKVRWQRFAEWKALHPEQAAAAAAIGKALRVLGPKRSVANDRVIERLERRLARARAATTWSEVFKRNARRRGTKA
jgi:hypothetical protein